MECHSPWWIELVTGVAEPIVTLAVLAVNVWQSRQMKMMVGEYDKIKHAIAAFNRKTPRSRS
jgi:hypothetical protein